MDTLLFHHNNRPCSATSKRPYAAVSDPISPMSLDPIQLDSLLLSFLSLSDKTTVPLLDHAFDDLIESSPDQNVMIERALLLGSVLLEAGKRSARKRDCLHNAVVWPLPPDLTIKVLTMLDTQSVCYAAAACSFFRKCASDPLCYASIDLITVIPKVNNMVVSTMIQRSGKALRSLKLGLMPGPTALFGSSQTCIYSTRNSPDISGFSWNDKRSRQGKESCILSRSCLSSLGSDNGAPGALLRRLHLNNIERVDNTALSAALSVCPSLLDLEIVGLHVELRQTLESVSKHCHLIERLFFESSKTGRDDSLKLSPTCSDLVQNCPNLNSLALRGFKLQDFKILALIKGFRKLKHLDFSTSYSISGAFLKKLVGGAGGNLLEVIILRDCMHLRKAEVERFISSIIAGEFKFLRHLDVSNREGLASEEDWCSRCYDPSFIPAEQLFRERPNFSLLAEFPVEGSFIEFGQMISSDDMSPPQQLSCHMSDGSCFVNTSDSCYNSDLGSGNEDNHDTSVIIYEESSDEADFLSV
ncbi:F-box protein SKIP17-like [Apium graveolens]|uniref:F-box protein SKIP17-like n=1 Tax=Apium graveolens TaxID=4045 RepID=UPI003D7A96F9